MVWALEQNLAIGPLETPLRCVVVKLASGKLWVHNPLAPTDEFFNLIASIESGGVSDVVVSTYALEHKVFAKDAMDRWRGAQLWVAPGQFSFPTDASDAFVWGRPPTGILTSFDENTKFKTSLAAAAIPDWSTEISCEVLTVGKFALGTRDVALYEATFLHRASKTLVVTDAVAYVPYDIPDLNTPANLLLVGKRSTKDAFPPDTYENRLAGWKKTCLLVTYFFPEHEILVNPTEVQWSEDNGGWERSFDLLAGRLIVPPVVRILLYSRDPKSVRKWVSKVSTDWKFKRILPAHWQGPIEATPVDLERAFQWLEDPRNIDVFPAGDTKRGLLAVASLLK
jgi:hypothetical protein